MFVFLLFRKGALLDKKRMRAYEITQIVQARKLNDEHIYLTMVFLDGISLHFVDWIIQGSVTGSVGNSVKYI